MPRLPVVVVLAAVVFASIGFTALPVRAASFVVTSIADAGAGSLREAITGVNAAAGPHVVNFDIPAGQCSAGGVCTIVLASALAPIEQPVSFDGTTQPRYGTAPSNVCATAVAPSYMRVEVDGLALPSSGKIFDFDSAGAAGVSEIRGLSLYTDFLETSISLTTAGAHRVQCNHLGVDGPGTAGLGNTQGVLIHMSAQGVIVGTDGDGNDDLSERNVISGNFGVKVNSNSDNQIAGNYFGTTADGITTLSPGCRTGVYMRQSSGNNQVGSDLDGTSDALEANVFAGCSTAAVAIDSWMGSGNGNSVVGNRIGTTADGSPAGNAVGINFNTPSFADAPLDQLISGNRIENNTTGIHTRNSVDFDPLSADNCLEDNTTGFEHEGLSNLVFEGSWWGAADGPSGAAPGSGDSLVLSGTGSFDADPFLSAGCPLPDFFVVTTTADAGPGSLREAITGVNAAAGPHVVNFDIPAGQCSAAGVCTIVLASALPAIEEPVRIDGTTQPRYGTAPSNVCATAVAPSYMRVEVDGLALPSSGKIFDFDSAGAAGVSEIRGLSLYTDFLETSISLTTAGAHRVQCNHLGVDGPGTAGLGNTQGVLIHMSAQGVIVGTDGDGNDDLSERNVISGNFGVKVNSNSDNQIAGNYFGTTADGTTTLSPGCRTGVYMRQQSGNNQIGSDLDGTSDALEANVFAGCTTAAITIESRLGSGDGNSVVGNRIGTTTDGTPAGNAFGIRFDPPTFANGALNQLVSENLIEHNTMGIFTGHNIGLDPLSADNCIEGNNTGFEHEGSENLVFENSWWGAADGPSGALPGSGDSLVLTGTGSFDADPFLSAGCPLPEPGAALSLGTGVLALAGLSRVRRRG